MLPKIAAWTQRLPHGYKASKEPLGRNRVCLTPKPLHLPRPPFLESTAFRPPPPLPTAPPILQTGARAGKGQAARPVCGGRGAAGLRGGGPGGAGVRPSAREPAARGWCGRRGSHRTRDDAGKDNDRGRKVAEGLLQPMAPLQFAGPARPTGPRRPPFTLHRRSSARPHRNSGAKATGTLRRPRGAKIGRVS
ncbi:uncharacterized protein LOC144579755 [Callithrix jacchus]